MKKKTILILMTVLMAMGAGAQGNASDQLKAQPKKSYGNDFPYEQKVAELTKTPEGYTPFYISHYARHVSRYYWNGFLYQELTTMLTKAHNLKTLTPEGEAFFEKFMAAKDELTTGVSELSDLGWEQHQWIARTMFNQFPEVFEKGGNVLAISSLTGRCVLSMSAFCQELVQCNPKIEIREQSSRFTLDGVVPNDGQNPVKHNFPKAKPRWEQNRDKFTWDNSLRKKVVDRVFTSIDSLPIPKIPGRPQSDPIEHIGSNLINLYTSLPNIGHEGMMGNIVTDEEMVAQWEQSNLGSYSWVFGPQNDMIPILEDIIKKTDNVLEGKSDRIADLRFGHDTCIGPLTVLMGINGADKDPEDPYEVKNIYQNWQTCKASNIQLVFYRPVEGQGDVLLKCLLNGKEASLPVPTTMAPYYKWSDFKQFYQDKISRIK